MVRDELLVVAVLVLLGALSKLIADRYRVPNVVFLLAFGIVLGPEGFDFFTGSLTSNQLTLFVDVAVAIIVFEGAFSLTLTRIRGTSRATLVLVTVGTAITFVGLTLVIRGLLGLEWVLSALIAALLVATGPTVITPILEQISVPEKVSSILETEGIINDPVAAVLGSVAFSVAIAPSLAAGESDALSDFVIQLGVGVLIGAITAVALAFVLREFSASAANSRFVVLAAALLAYAIATEFATEAGVVAVAVAGLAMGNSDIPFQDEIAGFSSTISSIVLSAVYIVLASLIRFEDIAALGLAGLGVVLAAMFVVRPLSVFVSTYGSDYAWNERLFIAGVGPRGIIPAATATLFSLQLADAGVANAATVVNLVFLVILVTVVTEAGGAPLLAKRLDIVPMNVLIIGGSDVGRTLADEIENRGGNPVIVERDEATVATLRAGEYSVVHGDGTDDSVLARAGAENTEMIVATTSDDAVNILACQIASSRFGVEQRLSLVTDTTKSDAFQDLGIMTITPTEATVTGIYEQVSIPSLFEWRRTVGHNQRLFQESVVSDTIDGKRIGELDLPAGCVIVLVQRGDEFIVPGQDVVLRRGDHVTILGQPEAVETARSLFTDGD
jgi:NhaP-type Na+/H+ or K+/H+ antiporter